MPMWVNILGGLESCTERGYLYQNQNFLPFPAEDGVPIGGILILEKASRFQLIFS